MQIFLRTFRKNISNRMAIKTRQASWKCNIIDLEKTNKGNPSFVRPLLPWPQCGIVPLSKLKIVYQAVLAFAFYEMND